MGALDDENATQANYAAIHAAIQSQIYATGECAGLECNPNEDGNVECAPASESEGCETLLGLTQGQGGWIPDEAYVDVCESETGNQTSTTGQSLLDANCGHCTGYIFGDNDQSSCSIECIFCSFTYAEALDDENATQARNAAIHAAIQSQIYATGECAGLECNPNEDGNVECSPASESEGCETLLNLTQGQGGWIPDEAYVDVCVSERDPLQVPCINAAALRAFS